MDISILHYELTAMDVLILQCELKAVDISILQCERPNGYFNPAV
jgi:hypothetical protein